MSKNVAVFVDVANIFYAAKAAGVDIDYVTLLKSASAGRDLVRAYAYTGLDPENENQRNFHSFLARHGYRVVSKDIRKYGDGKVKANLDIELVVDMMKTARNLDIAIVVSGDGDFAPAIRAVQEMGVRVEVISFRGNTSSDLIDVADSFTDITALAKVEKGSSRSGRRVAEAADEDLSMTEVPDKQTEGAGDRRRGGRGRGGRGRGREEETPVRSRRPIGEPAAVTSSGAPLVVLPGERLSRAAGGPGGDVDETDDLIDPETGGAVAAFGGALGGFETRGPVDVEDAELANGAAAGDGDADADADAEGEDAEGRRRRRRRGGRGRGRGRGREGEAQERPLPIGATAGEDPAGDDEGYEEPPVEAPRGPRTTPFGSVWDSQLGVPSMPSTAAPTPLGDDEDFEEPEIPEYLIAERRNRGRQGPQAGRGGGGRGGPRGGRSAYAAAIERERYGRGGGGGGINRYPDVSARERPVEPRREERPARPVGGAGAGAGGGAPRRSGGDEPWSEVPPELEAMLRAQLGSRPADRRPEPRPAEPRSIADAPVPSDPLGAVAPSEDEEEAIAAQAAVVPDGAYETADLPAPEPVEDAAAPAAEAAPRRRTTRRPRATAEAASTSDEAATLEGASPAADPDSAAETAAPKRRTTRRRTAAAADDAVAPVVEAVPTADAAGGAEPEAAEAPKRRVTRRRTTVAGDATAPAEGDAPAAHAIGDEAAPAPKRRTTRRRVAEETPGE